MNLHSVIKELHTYQERIDRVIAASNGTLKVARK